MCCLNSLGTKCLAKSVISALQFWSHGGHWARSLQTWISPFPPSQHTCVLWPFPTISCWLPSLEQQDHNLMSFCSCCARSLLCQLLSTLLLTLLMFVTCFASLFAMGPLSSVWWGLWILSRRWCSRTRAAIAEEWAGFLACAPAPRAVWFLAQQPWFSIVSLREISFGLWS